jgi:hypothetical protein
MATLLLIASACGDDVTRTSTAGQGGSAGASSGAGGNVGGDGIGGDASGAGATGAGASGGGATVSASAGGAGGLSGDAVCDAAAEICGEDDPGGQVEDCTASTACVAQCIVDAQSCDIAGNERLSGCLSGCDL